MSYDTYVFPTSRARRLFMAQADEGFLPQLLTLGELFASIRICRERKDADRERQIMTLFDAFCSTKENPLALPNNYIAFRSQAGALLSFYDELCAENVAWESLNGADTYAFYDEHITFLQTLFQRYEILLEEGGYGSSLTYREGQTDTLFCTSLGKVLIVIEGYLTEYELDLLDDLATHTPLHLKIALHEGTMVEKLRRRGILVESFHEFLLDWTAKSIMTSTILHYDFSHLSSMTTATRHEQVGALMNTLHKWLAEGVAPEQIGIIIPDESFQSELALFDEKRNFNFAMGHSLTATLAFKKTSALLEALHDITPETFRRLTLLGIHETFEAIKNFQPLDVLLKELWEEEKEIWESIKLQWLTPYMRFSLSPSDALALFLSLVTTIRQDDIGGGRITVMGVLESRLMSFDRVFIFDFNDSIVPSTSDKELFLSTDIRQRAGLPTFTERQRLQLFFYQRLLFRAKEGVLTYTTQNNARPSVLLHNFEGMGIREENFTLISPQHSFSFSPSSILLPPSHTRVSASALADFCNCKKRYYYRYGAKFMPPKEEQGKGQIGTAIHALLEKLYNDPLPKNCPPSFLKNRFLALCAYENDPLLRFALESFAHQSETLWENEAMRFHKGAYLVAKEKSFSFLFHNVTLHGYIDRIDQTSQGYEVLDYKYKTYVKTDEANDFQLTFYALACYHIFGVYPIMSAYYDLKKGCIVKEENFETKKMELAHTIEFFRTYQGEYEKCDDSKLCRFCPYTVLCDRE